MHPCSQAVLGHCGGHLQLRCPEQPPAMGEITLGGVRRLGNIWSPGFDPVGRRELTGLFGEQGKVVLGRASGAVWGHGCLGWGSPQMLCIPICDTRGIPTFNNPCHLWRGGSRWQQVTSMGRCCSSLGEQRGALASRMSPSRVSPVQGQSPCLVFGAGCSQGQILSFQKMSRL